MLKQSICLTKINKIVTQLQVRRSHHTLLIPHSKFENMKQQTKLNNISMDIKHYIQKYKNQQEQLPQIPSRFNTHFGPFNLVQLISMFSIQSGYPSSVGAPSKRNNGLTGGAHVEFPSPSQTN
eukprot:TRINITY_DN5799_c0_g1_i1.p3 TRINITY_DN5799_c0_g1~~TRINITY_DN5799_c0_g1_i1.p3  ORF type:complete len:143 (+),score=3.54 TRINITY_DN5799_c0_g1_i1:61-429(+)